MDEQSALLSQKSDVSEPPPAAPPRTDTASIELSLWEWVSFSVAHAVTAGLLYCLTLRGLYRFGRMFGTIEWCVDYKRRRRFDKAVVRVLDHAPSRKERRRLGREFFIRTRCDKLFYLIVDRIPRDQAASLLSIPNRGLIDEALARGNGLYLAMSHHGSHHVLAMLLALNGYRPAAVRDRNEGALRRYVQRRFDLHYPDFHRMRVLFADSFPRDVFRCLKEGYVLGSAMDVNRVRHESQKTEEVTIFGERRKFLSGPLRIARRCKAGVLQAFVFSEPNFRYRLELVDGLIDYEADTDESSAISTAMQSYAATVERYVRRDPTLLTRI